MVGLIDYNKLPEMEDIEFENPTLQDRLFNDIAHSLASISQSLKVLTDAYDPDAKCINVQAYLNTQDRAIEVQIEPGQYPLTIQDKGK